MEASWKPSLGQGRWSGGPLLGSGARDERLVDPIAAALPVDWATSGLLRRTCSVS